MASRQYLHLIFLVSLLLSSPYLSLSQISVPPSLPPTSSTSSADSLANASPPEPSDSIPPSSSPLASPPAFSPSSDDLPDEAPAPSPLSPSVPVPVPAPSNAEMKASSLDGEEQDDTEKKGLNSGGKAGVVIGVFAATALVGLGVLVCKKRQDNIRRSRYDYTSRVEMI